MTPTTIILPKPIYLIVKMDFSKKMKRGMKAKVDQIRSAIDCESGIMMRVVNLYKNPTWFDSGWFSRMGDN